MSQLRDFVDAASDWLWEMDADLRFTLFSERFEAEAGIDRAGSIGKRRADITADDVTSPDWRRHLADLEARRPFRDFRYSVRRPDGSLLYWSVSGRPFFDGDGVFQGYRGIGRDVTAEVLLPEREAALAEQSALLQAALDATDQGFAVFDAGRRLVAWNHHYLEMLGLSAAAAASGLEAEALLRRYASNGVFGPGDVEAQVHDRLEFIFGPAAPRERELRLPSGRELEIRRYDMAGGGRVLTFTDVTERVRAAAALREANDRYQTILANMPGVVFRRVMRADGAIYIAFASEGIRSVYGYDPEGYISDPVRWQEAVHPDDRKRFRAEVEHSARTLEPLDTELRVLAAGGEPRWHRSISRPRRSAGGETVWDGLAFDVTKRREAEIAHRESEERFRSIVEAVSIPLVISRVGDGEILFANEPAGLMAGIPARDLVGRRTTEFYRGRNVWHDLLEALARDGYVRDRQITLGYPGRPEFSVMVSLRPLVYRDEDAIVASCVDVTERERSARELARHRDRLEALVAERTRALESAQEDLLRSERLAAIGQLTATVSHELRNPLGTIVSSFYAVRARLGEMEPALERSLDRIDRNIQRCDNIIEELLTFTRSPVLDLAPVRFDEWVAETVNGEAVPAGVNLELGCAGVTIEMDRNRMHQALTNVVHNAVHAMAGPGGAPGGGRVEAVTERAGDRVELRISDSGPGIPEENLDKIFEPLFSTKSFGVGLGLPLVKQVLEQHGGGVRVATEPGRGTTVTLWLPISRE